MGKLSVFLFLSILLSCSANPIGMFDFTNRNVSRCTPNVNYLHRRNSTASEFAAAILKEAPNRLLPEKITICETIYVDLEDCDRYYPTWAFANESGKINLSMNVNAYVDYFNTEKDGLRFRVETEKKQNPKDLRYSSDYSLGRLQLSI